MYDFITLCKSPSQDSTLYLRYNKFTNYTKILQRNEQELLIEKEAALIRYNRSFIYTL